MIKALKEEEKQRDTNHLSEEKKPQGLVKTLQLIRQRGKYQEDKQQYKSQQENQI